MPIGHAYRPDRFVGALLVFVNVAPDTWDVGSA